MDDETRPGGDETRLSGSAQPSRPKSSSVSGSGWLSSTPDIDHGRFPPGTIVADRYRIIGLLGRGGMGEVFRADDLRLGQPVALKFLPTLLERDPVRLAQFHNEVRTARQVSHANVCRVYDIGEADGQHFLTMEFIDGEDLSSLLRRIGRLPEDKAIEIARQICAGLHAAHDRGLLHRDLKPANVMLDREGRVRITDFSLAAVAGTVEDVRAGTPAYMAPEQLAGREVTVRSDIYALGLVLYELFTGKRALDAKSIADLIARQESGAITMPTDLVTSLDPVIERAIMRCLVTDPAKRPSSALAVAASLPGGDPLAAALAAGETPSPEMVAAAGGETAAMTPLQGVAWMAVALALLAAIAVLHDAFMITSRAPFDRAPEVLLDRARTLQASLGISAGADYAHGFGYSAEYVEWLEQTRDGQDRFAPLAHPQPAALLYWYRSSPRLLIASDGRGEVGYTDPPILVSGMVNMILGSDGTLYDFNWVPPQVDSLGAPPPAPLDWDTFFAAAGLDRTRFRQAAPDWTPRSYADTREAWTGTYAHMPDVPVRVDAASYRGWPVFFQVTGPWVRPSRMQDATGNRGRVASAIANVVVAPALIFTAAWLARRNVKRGRGDRRGAARVGAFIVVLHVAAWLFRAHHLPDPGQEIGQFFGAFAYYALFQAGLFYVFYLAIEPHVRRVWPHILITWSRLLGGGVRDPLVGRDVVIGVTAGLLLTLITMAYQYVPVIVSQPEFAPATPDLEAVASPWLLLSSLLMRVSNAIQNGALGVLGLVLLRMLLKRTWAAFAAGCVIFGSMAASGQFESAYPVLDYAFGVVLCVVLLFVVLRWGMFATMMAFVAHFFTLGIAATLDSSRVNFGAGVATFALLAAMVAAGFYLARAGEPLFGKVLED